VLASIPPPPFDSLDIGPLSLNIYGLSIALGVIAAVWLFGRRLEERGVGTRDDASAIAIGAVAAGVIGARLYHVATDWERFSDDLGEIPALWNGGLGIPGGLLLGIPVGLWLARRRGITIADAATCAAPAIPLAQAIGRWGNYFNQELYGRPTDLPWALEVDPDKLEPGYAVGTTFHPTFLYESLWNLGLVGVLLWVDRRYRPGGGSLMGLYLAGYGLGRFWVEGLRIDRADELAGLRWNQWVALAAVVGGLALFQVLRTRAAAVGDPTIGADADDGELVGEDLGDVTEIEIDPDETEVDSDEIDPDEIDPGGTDDRTDAT
jgi:prolipoprotein diacylglyceryl transferase